MKRLINLSCFVALLFSIVVPLKAVSYRTLFEDDFETAWAGDYAPGWVNAAYRHGTPPIGKMMQQTTTSHSGSHGLKLTADSVPQDWMWWAAVEVDNLPHKALAKKHDPYVSVWYYDELGDLSAGQLYAVPDWVNPYLPGGEDWTDVQYGGRFGANNDNYYHVAVGESHPGWQDTGVSRTNTWHNLKFQLSSADGHIHFYHNDVSVGKSYRNDYTNLGTAIGLYTMFQPKLSDFGNDKPYTIWDDFKVASTVPETGTTFILLGTGFLGLAIASRKRVFRKS